MYNSLVSGFGINMVSKSNFTWTKETMFFSCNFFFFTWLKLSSALWRLANIPVGGSLVILIEASRIPCGMICESLVPAGSALMYTR